MRILICVKVRHYEFGAPVEISTSLRNLEMYYHHGKLEYIHQSKSAVWHEFMISYFINLIIFMKSKTKADYWSRHGHKWQILDSLQVWCIF